MLCAQPLGTLVDFAPFLPQESVTETGVGFDRTTHQQLSKTPYRLSLSESDRINMKMLPSRGGTLAVSS